jgi:hypothetical protein
MTGAITTNSTFDGRDVAADGVTADAALPKAGGTMTGVIAGFTSTGIDDNATSTAITIDASENVGIGTASPDGKLEVEGSTASTYIRVKGTVADGYRHGYELQNTHTGGRTWSMFTTNNSDGVFGGGKLVFSNVGADSATAANSPLVINAAGIVTKPYQPAFLARGLSSVPASASVFIYNSVTFDRTSSYSTSTGRFTAPVAGVYLFTFNSMGNISDSRYMCRLYLNGANFAQSSSSSNSSQYQDGKLSIHVNLAVSDYVYMYNAGPKVPHSTSATEEWFSGHLVG